MPNILERISNIIKQREERKQIIADRDEIIDCAFFIVEYSSKIKNEKRLPYCFDEVIVDNVIDLLLPINDLLVKEAKKHPFSFSSSDLGTNMVKGIREPMAKLRDLVLKTKPTEKDDIKFKECVIKAGDLMAKNYDILVDGHFDILK